VTKCDLDTGTIHDPDGDNSGDVDPSNWMAVPDYYFKLLCDVDTKKSIAYYGHNRNDDKVTAVTVRDLEAKVGLTFWPDDACSTGAKDDDYWFTLKGAIAQGLKKRANDTEEIAIIYV